MELRLIVVAVVFCTVCGFSAAQRFKIMHHNTNITASGCGESKLCVRVDNCDPAGNASCFFSSTQFNDTVLSVELSGNTSGYVALGLTPTTNLTHQLTQGAVVFVCGNNYSTGFFETAIQNGLALMPVEVAALNISAVQVSVNKNRTLIKCSFRVTLNSTILNLISGSSNGNVMLPFNVTILKGYTNGTALENATIVFDSNGPLDLADPRSNIPATTPAPTTTAVSVTPLSITRTGCSNTKLCLSSPSNCDPAGNSECFFNSVRLSSQVFFFELSGTTAGYVALGLAQNDVTTVFICGNNSNSGDFFFETAEQTNNNLALKNVSTVHFVQGVASKDKTLIQCIFNTSVTFTFRAEETMYRVTILNGTTSGTQLGNPKVLFDSLVALDLSNPKANSSGKLIGSLWTNVLAMLLGALTLRFL